MKNYKMTATVFALLLGSSSLAYAEQGVNVGGQFSDNVMNAVGGVPADLGVCDQILIAQAKAAGAGDQDGSRAAWGSYVHLCMPGLGVNN